jgi:Zn-dependent protease with chaperone function
MKSYVLRNKGRDQTWRWLLAFGLAFIATLVVSSYVLSMFLYHHFGNVPAERSFFFVPWYVWVPVTIFTARVTFYGHKWSEWVGKPSARMFALLELLDASRVPEDTPDLAVRRLININEEIAIAAGCLAADVYVLQNDYSINALTIGSSKVAAICVTRGALRTLRRTEMQAVIAHEYGHLVNDDVTRNTQLLYWLSALLPLRASSVLWRPGRTFIGFIVCGALSRGIEALLHMAGEGPGKFAPFFGFVAGICAVGIAVMIIRSVWHLGANSVRAAFAGLTRERELEADGISAQLTRDPASLAAVLRKIAGLRQESSFSPRHAAMVSHMCIASGLFGTDHDLFATHPALEERLRALGHPLTTAERAYLSENHPEAIEQYAAEVNAELGIVYAADPMN